MKIDDLAFFMKCVEKIRRIFLFRMMSGLVLLLIKLQVNIYLAQRDAPLSQEVAEDSQLPARSLLLRNRTALL